MKYENFNETKTLIENYEWTKLTQEEIEVRISQVLK